jgi:spore germination protein (amino acid permease)
MDKFSSKHFLVIIFTTCIVSLKTYPSIYLRNGGRDSWIAIIIASVLIILFFMSLINICKKNNAYSLKKIYTTALGDRVGRFFIGLLIISLFLTLVECASVEANAMHTNLLMNTPIWYLLLFFIIPCVYVVRQDIAAIVILVVIVIPIIIISGMTLALLTSKYKKYQYIFPIFENGVNMNFFICILKMLGLYGCVTISLPYLSRIKNTSKIGKHTFIALIIVIQMQIISVSGLIMTFTPERLLDLIYPKLLQTQLVSYMQFIEYGELYVLFQVLGGWLLKYIVTFYALLILLKELNLERKTLIYATYIISIMVFVFASIAANNTFFLFKLLNYYSYFCFVNFVALPFFIFTRYSIISKKANKHIHKY